MIGHSGNNTALQTLIPMSSSKTARQMGAMPKTMRSAAQMPASLPQSYAELKKRADQEPRTTAVNAAVSDHTGRATFHVASLAVSCSLKVPLTGLGDFEKYLVQKKKTVDVTLVRLDDEMQRLGIDLLKMDAQGGELDIINGIATYMERKAVRVIFSEVCFTGLYDNAPLCQDIATRLESLGYRLHALYNIVSDKNGRLGWGDAISYPTHHEGQRAHFIIARCFGRPTERLNRRTQPCLAS